MNEVQLPPHWKKVRLENVATIEMGHLPPGET